MPSCSDNQSSRGGPGDSRRYYGSHRLAVGSLAKLLVRTIPRHLRDGLWVMQAGVPVSAATDQLGRTPASQQPTWSVGHPRDNFRLYRRRGKGGGMGDGPSRLRSKERPRRGSKHGGRGKSFPLPPRSCAPPPALTGGSRSLRGTPRPVGCEATRRPWGPRYPQKTNADETTVT